MSGSWTLPSRIFQIAFRTENLMPKLGIGVSSIQQAGSTTPVDTRLRALSSRPMPVLPALRGKASPDLLGNERREPIQTQIQPPTTVPKEISALAFVVIHSPGANCIAELDSFPEEAHAEDGIELGITFRAYIICACRYEAHPEFPSYSFPP